MITRRSHKAQAGSFIIEAMISLVLFAVGLITLVGLAVQSLNQVGQTKARNDASYLAGDLIGEMWVSASTPAAFLGTADYGRWTTRVTATLPAGVGAAVVNGNQVAITITWTDSKNSAVGHQYVTTSEIVKN